MSLRLKVKGQNLITNRTIGGGVNWGMINLRRINDMTKLVTFLVAS